MTFNLCVLTAANEIQAEGYRKQIAWREKRGMLPKSTEFIVVADPKGKRVGSGGSTLVVLHQLLRREHGDFERAFQGRHILILHSGGDSKRLPAYSALGKAFMPLPSERFFAVFDVLLDTFSQLPALPEGQVIVASGDVLLTFDAEGVVFGDTGVTGVAYPDLPDVASRHGVYVSDAGNLETNPRKVLHFLQKPSLSELRAASALDLSGRAFVDTGIQNLALDVVKKLVSFGSLIEDVSAGKTTLDIYKEIPLALLGQEPIPQADGLDDFPFSVSLLPYCGFFHVGSSQELLRNFHVLTHAGLQYAFYPFTRMNFGSMQRHAVGENAALNQAFVYNTALLTSEESLETAPLRVDGPVFIEGCSLDGELVLEGENLLTGLPEGAGNIHLRRELGLHLLPMLNGQWAAVLYGLRDSFKGSLGTQDGTYLNQDLSQWMADHNIGITDLWPAEDEGRSLWSARLFPVSNGPTEAVEVALTLQSDNTELMRWREANRLSLAEILCAADHDVILARYARVESQAKLRQLTVTFTPKSEVPAEEILSWCQERDDYRLLHRQVETLLRRTADKPFQARLYKLLAKAEAQAGGTPHDSAELENRAFTCVREAIGQGLMVGSSTELPELQIRSDEVVWACASARLDFAGGWSDTPPYCLEYGGTVLNAAIQLNGQYPIQVIGKIHDERIVRINSIDLAQNAVITEMSDLRDYTDPGSWLALPKAAFVASGALPQSVSSLDTFLRHIGGGIDLTLFSAVPSGSGLGTSSILGAALIACLGRMFGVTFDPDALFNRTLYMEQLMTTGGGWQDQIGGVVGGVKLIRAEAGLYPQPTFAWTQLMQPGQALSDRFLMYYTGYRRMAKNILQHIVGKYLERDANTLHCISELRHVAEAMKVQLDHRDIDAFGSSIHQAWELNKRLDPGTTTPEIEAILGTISDHILGAKLLGAGGGGFLFIVTRGPEHSREIRRRLSAQPPNDRARFFDFSVDPQGLQVSVL